MHWLSLVPPVLCDAKTWLSIVVPCLWCCAGNHSHSEKAIEQRSMWAFTHWAPGLVPSARITNATVEDSIVVGMSKPCPPTAATIEHGVERGANASEEGSRSTVTATGNAFTAILGYVDGGACRRHPEGEGRSKRSDGCGQPQPSDGGGPPSHPLLPASRLRLRFRGAPGPAPHRGPPTVLAGVFVAPPVNADVGASPTTCGSANVAPGSNFRMDTPMSWDQPGVIAVECGDRGAFLWSADLHLMGRRIAHKCFWWSSAAESPSSSLSLSSVSPGEDVAAPISSGGGAWQAAVDVTLMMQGDGSSLATFQVLSDVSSSACSNDEHLLRQRAEGLARGAGGDGGEGNEAAGCGAVRFFAAEVESDRPPGSPPLAIADFGLCVAPAVATATEQSSNDKRGDEVPPRWHWRPFVSLLTPDTHVSVT